MLRQVYLAGAAALFVLRPVNSGSGWGFQHPSCQGYGAVPGNAGRSSSVRHGVSQLRLSAVGGLIPKRHRVEATSEAVLLRRWEMPSLWVWEQRGARGLGFTWLSRWINSSLLPTSLASPPCPPRLLSMLCHLWEAVWLECGKNQMTENTLFIFFFFSSGWLSECAAQHGECSWEMQMAGVWGVRGKQWGLCIHSWWEKNSQKWVSDYS